MQNGESDPEWAKLMSKPNNVCKSDPKMGKIDPLLENAELLKAGL